MISNNIKKEIKEVYFGMLMICITMGIIWLGMDLMQNNLQTELNTLNTSLTAKINSIASHSQVTQNTSTQDLIITINKGILRSHVEDKNYTCYDYLQDLTLFLDTNKTKQWR